MNASRHAYVSFATHVPATADEEEIIGILRKAEPENENRCSVGKREKVPGRSQSGRGPSDGEPGSKTENR
jgi:hypothetical protein